MLYEKQTVKEWCAKGEGEASTERLRKQIDALTNDGWVPQGSIFVTVSVHTDPGCLISQELRRRKPLPE